MKRFAVVLIAVLTLGISAFAQTTTSGDIAGTITDPTGAVVPNAPLTVSNDATGRTVNVTSNSSGFYRVANLPPGTYTISTTVAGFGPAKKRADVAVGTVTTINLALSPASTQTTVEVTAEAPVIETENGNIQNTHDTREIDLLPNGGGDQTYIAQTSPGININTTSGPGSHFGSYGNFSAFGLPGTANLFTVNGNDNMDPYLNLNNSGATNLTLGANELAEVSVVSNGYSVQYGRQAGAQVNSVTKSGGNSFHGNAIYYWNGRVMNADNWFNKHVDTSKGQTPTPTGFVNANQWSASFGGPIKKDKTFFFVDTEGLRVVIPVPAQVFTPTQVFQNYVLTTGLPSNQQSAQAPFYQKIFGIFNSAPGSNNARPANTSDDPALGCGDLSNTPVPGVSNGVFGPTDSKGNPIPASSTVTPVPCAQTYHSDFPNRAQEWTLAARFDHQLTANDKIYIRYHQDKGLQPTYTDPLSPVFNTNSNQPAYDGQLNETHTFGTKAVNQLIVSGAYYRAIFVSTNQAASLAAYPFTTIFGDGLFSNVGGINYDFPQGRNVTQWQIVDDLSFNSGNHTFKLGMNFRRNDVTDYTTGVLTIPLQEVLSMTDFSQGISDLAEQRFPQRLSNPLSLWSGGWYGEDDWRATDKLKLTLGLRIDHDSNPVCKTNCFNRLAGPFETLGLTNTVPYNQAIQANLNQGYPKIDNLLWQPRVGFAYQLGTNTVVRGGAGLFYDLLPSTLVDNYIRNAPGDITLIDASASNPLSPNVPGSTFSVLTSSAAAFRQQYAAGGTLSSIAAAVPAFAGISYQTTAAKIRTPQFQEWNLMVEHALGAKMSVSANYVGSHGVHIPMYDPWLNVACRTYGAGSATPGANVCPALASTPRAGFTPITTTRPDSAFSTVRELTSNGYSHSDGVTVALQRKFSAGLQAQVSYTYAHALDSISNGGVLPWNGDDSLLTQISPFGQQLNYGNADYDVRHSMNANYVYELPFKFGNGFLNNIVGGWTIAGTFFLHSGYPFTVLNTTGEQALLRNGSSTVMPAIISAPVDYTACTSGPSINVNNPNSCLSKSSFTSIQPVVDPATGAILSTPHQIPAFFSNQHRNSFRGPGYFNTDLSIRKAFKLSERFRLSVGANAYNVLNHPNFAAPTTTLEGSLGSFYTTVGPPTGALGSGLGGDNSARTVQLEGRLSF